MPTSVTQYNLLISCPSDVRDEIDIIKQTVQRFNEQFSEKFKIVFVVKHWKQDAYPEAGDKPQTLLNRQIVDNCDAAVAIFWKRFGTPTEKYQSGTEEEIAIMLESNKQVFMYFSEIPTDNVVDNKEIEKIKAYREEYSKNGLYDTYSTIKQFEDLFYNHLISYAKEKQRDVEISQKRQPVLKLVGIDEKDNLLDVVKILQFRPKGEYDVQICVDALKNKYTEIMNCRVNNFNVNKGAYFDPQYSKIYRIEIAEDDKQVILKAASVLEISVDSNFFDLGTLAKIKNFVGYEKIIGNEEEEKKYNLINELKNLLANSFYLLSINKKIIRRKCVKLALENCGTTIDRDIEIKLTIPKSALITVKDFPQFDNEQMRYLLYDCEMDELFGIPEAVQYNDYYSSQEKPIGYVQPYIDPLTDKMSIICRQKIDYSEPFFNKLKDIIGYSVYESNENYILKLKFDYLKHNTTVAFPSVIFLKNDIDTLTYQITSQNNEDVINGEIKVVAE